MIAKAIKGRGFRGAVSYDLNDEKGYRLDSNMAGETPRQLAAEFGAVRALRPNLKKAVTHVSLAAAPGETLSDDQWRAIAQDYLDGMGYDDNQYLVTRHTDTDHDHIHIIANRIKHDGGVVSDSHDYPRQERIMREVEQRYGLQATRSSHEASHKALTKGEIEQAVRTQQEPPRQALQRLVSEAAQGNPTASQFADRLAGAGVEVRANIASTGKMNGFSFGLDGQAYSGSKLGKGFTWKALQEKGVSYEQDRDRPTLERFAKGAAAGPGDPNRGRAAEATDRDQRTDQPDQANHGTADGGQPGNDQQAEPAATIGSPGRDDQGSGERLRSADSGAGRTDPGGDGSDRRDQRRGENRDTQADRRNEKRAGSSNHEGGQRQAGRGNGQRVGREGQKTGPGSQHSRAQHGQANGGGHGPVSLGGLAGDLRDLAERHVITPKKAREAIDKQIAQSPAPARPAGRKAPTGRLARWFSSTKSKLTRFVEKARDYFNDAAVRSAGQGGWSTEEVRAAGMSGDLLAKAEALQAKLNAEKARQQQEAQGAESAERLKKIADARQKPEEPDIRSFDDEDDGPGGPSFG
ncbi:relaxase/mobilization nuclease domain-containing protein [Marinobacter adhaerens]|uniref:Relaxase/mobilization nuclease domain-containing protein n=1 Tax=Marinobacter adhaerens TaxID=1033846 RepID=A0A851HV86_9GAMM|nr:relaxase/mobilization nuclease domain-containing protein [Marinobacter adhaerens]NWN92957.1 relaxase/mobilization nuclease domain-containing protein [Marinobacter adhaerens]